MKLIGAPRCKYYALSLVSIFVGLLPFAAIAQPDLVIPVSRSVMTVEYRRIAFDQGDCAYQEGCVRGTGGRKMLLLDTGVRNVGASDLVMGDPGRRPDLFVWSPCHQHYHLKGLANYRVLTLSGTPVAKAYKQGFCLRDDAPKMPNSGVAKFTCAYQGISSGWQDTYDKSLDCQWVDITGVPAGAYNLEIVVNPNRILPESNYKNNKVVFRINVPRYVNY